MKDTELYNMADYQPHGMLAHQSGSRPRRDYKNKQSGG